MWFTCCGRLPREEQRQLSTRASNIENKRLAKVGWAQEAGAHELLLQLPVFPCSGAHERTLGYCITSVGALLRQEG